MLKRLDPTAYKKENYVISGNSIIFHLCNDSTEALDLLATRSITRPVFLGLGGTRNSFWQWRFKVSDMKPELLPFGSLTHWIISQVLASGFRLEYQFTSPDNGRIGGIRDRNKEKEMLKKVEMGKKFQEMPHRNE